MRADDTSIGKHLQFKQMINVGSTKKGILGEFTPAHSYSPKCNLPPCSFRLKKIYINRFKQLIPKVMEAASEWRSVRHKRLKEDDLPRVDNRDFQALSPPPTFCI